MQMKTALDETRLQLQSAKNQHTRQIEMMEVTDVFMVIYVWLGIEMNFFILVIVLLEHSTQLIYSCFCVD